MKTTFASIPEQALKASPPVTAYLVLRTTAQKQKTDHHIRKAKAACIQRRWLFGGVVNADFEGRAAWSEILHKITHFEELTNYIKNDAGQHIVVMFDDIDRVSRRYIGRLETKLLALLERGFDVLVLQSGTFLQKGDEDAGNICRFLMEHFCFAKNARRHFHAS